MIYIIPLPTVMAWCMAAACGGGGLLCNLGVPSVAVSWSCHLVNLTQSPRQHCQQLALPQSPPIYYVTCQKTHRTGEMSWNKLIQALQFTAEWVTGRRTDWLSVMINEDHTDRSLFDILYCVQVTVQWALQCINTAWKWCLYDQWINTRWS